MEDNAAVEDIVQAHIFLYGLDIVGGYFIGELAARIVGKHSKTVRLLHYNSHSSLVSIINALFKPYRCPWCDRFFGKAYN